MRSFNLSRSSFNNLFLSFLNAKLPESPLSFLRLFSLVPVPLINLRWRHCQFQSQLFNEISWPMWVLLEMILKGNVDSLGFSDLLVSSLSNYLLIFFSSFNLDFLFFLLFLDWSWLNFNLGSLHLYHLDLDGNECHIWY